MALTTEKVWEEFNTGLKQFILKRVPEEQSAEDILQDVFLKIHTHINTLRNEEKLQSWMYQIARNAIYDYYRNPKTTNTALELLEPEHLFAPEDDPSDNIIAELTPCIKAMIDSLPNDYREALILTEYHRLTQKQLAEKLGISLPGAKSRVQRAREKLKTMLLDCCHLEFDRLGRVIDYQPRCNCCSACRPKMC